jgi:ParB family transcriptional regulator, chromosome partitioning protein
MMENNGTLQISVDKIVPNRFQPRLEFNEKALNELADSIKEHGIIQPLVLRNIGDKYEIIAGERRYKAARMLGFKTVPAVIRNVDNTKSAELAVVENIQRKDLSAIEEAQSYKKLMDEGMTQEEIAKTIGVAQSTVANKIRLLSLPSSVQNALLEAKISERHARSLLSLQDSFLQEDILNKIILNRWTVRQTEEEISKITGKSTPDEPKFIRSDVNELLKPEEEKKLDLSKTNINTFPSLEELKKSIMEDTNNNVEEENKNSGTEEILDFELFDESSTNDSQKEENDSVNTIKKVVEELKNKGSNIDIQVHDFMDEYNILIKIKK